MRQNGKLATNTLTEKERLLREYAKKHDITDLAGVLASGSALLGDTSLPETRRPGDATEGLDYAASDSEVDKIKLFSTIGERVENFDVLAGKIIEKFSGTTGHTHSGVDGAGPKIPAKAVDLDSSAVNGDSTAEAHMNDSVIHNIAGMFANARPFYFFDDFTEDDLAKWWMITEGSPSRLQTDGIWVLDLPAGSKICLGTADDAWVNCFCLEFLLYMDASAPAGMKVHVDQAADGTYPVYFKEAADTTCGIYKVGGTTYAEGAPVSAGSFIRYRLSCYSGVFTQWIDLTGSARQQLFKTTGISGGNGILEFEAVGHCRIAEVHLIRYAKFDTGIFTDFLGRFTQGGQTLGPHASTHYADGSDPLDVNVLADHNKRRLTPYEKQKLFSGGPGSNPHLQSDVSIMLTGADGNGWALGGHSELDQHVRDGSLHAAPLPVASDEPIRGLVPCGTDTIQGDVYQAARLDHTHPVPCWFVERLLIYHSGTQDVVAVSRPEYFAGDALLAGYTQKKLYMAVPTVAGEYADAGKEPNRQFYAAHTINGTFTEECHRMRLPLYNTTGRDIEIMYAVPKNQKYMWIIVKNAVDGVTPYPGFAQVIGEDTLANPVQTVNLLLRPGANDIIIYVTKSTGFSNSAVLYPIASTEGGIMKPCSVFSKDIIYRPVYYKADSPDPAYLEPAAYL